MALAEFHQERYRALIYLAVDSGMRWSELIGLRRARVDLGLHKVRVTEQMIRLDGGKWCEHRRNSLARRCRYSPPGSFGGCSEFA